MIPNPMINPQVNDSVFVITCGGVFPGKIRKVELSFFGDTIYYVKGPDIITCVKEVYETKPLIASPCDGCNNANDCLNKTKG